MVWEFQSQIKVDLSNYDYLNGKPICYITKVPGQHSWMNSTITCSPNTDLNENINYHYE